MELINFITIFAALHNIEGVSKSEPTEFYGHKRIVDGSAIRVRHVPYQVSLFIYNKPKYGGTLISSFHVLTGAHCLTHIKNKDNVSAKEAKVRAAVSQAYERGITMLIELVRSHKDYSPKPLKNDIAIIKLKKAAIFSEWVKPIPLYTKWPKPGDSCVATGYGSQSGSNYMYPETTLKIVYLQIYDPSECLWLGRDGICAANKKGKDNICSGDSGGPLTINGSLAGISSAVFGCGLHATPAAFTNVRYHFNWIYNCMQRTLVGASSC